MHAFSALTLLVQQQEGHLACEEISECWYPGDDDLTRDSCRMMCPQSKIVSIFSVLFSRAFLS